MTKGTKSGGNGATGPSLPVLGARTGPPTLPLDEVFYMMKELEDAHRILDALDLPPGMLSDRLVHRARRWLAKCGESSQAHPAIEARIIIKAAGESAWVPPSKGGNESVKRGKTDG